MPSGNKERKKIDGLKLGKKRSLKWLIRSRKKLSS